VLALFPSNLDDFKLYHDSLAIGMSITFTESRSISLITNSKSQNGKIDFYNTISYNL
jgi:hypothetical protein